MKTIILNPGVKLGQVLPFLPNGIIDKTETGIGATTLEATCQRNSIIVEPTRAIVADKSKILSSLGFMGGETEDKVLEYLKEVKGQFKKIFVVSDSVSRLIAILKDAGEDVYNDYFYCLDEVEQYTTEAGYRANMGIAIDHYKLFPPLKRAMVSAYVYDSSNPFIQSEPKTKYCYEVSKTRNIHLKITDNPTLEAIETIKRLEGKSLIFMNSLVDFNAIIELGNLPKQDCAVYCSPDSKGKVGELYKSFNNIPEYKYNFFTSAFFSGVDIKGDYHVVTIVNVNLQHTILSPSKLKQIAGRVRDNILTDTIITNYSSSLKLPYDDYIKSSITEGEELIEKVKTDHHFIKLRESILKDGICGIKLIRKDKDGKVVLNYEEIDCGYIQLKYGAELYSSPEGLYNYLLQQGHIVNKTNSNHSFSQEEINKMKDFRVSIKEDRLKASQYVYSLVKRNVSNGKYSIGSIDLDYRQLMYESTGTTKQLLNLFLTTGNAELIKDSQGDPKKINGYESSHRYSKLKTDHFFCRKLSEYFKLNEKYTTEEIAKRLTMTFKETGVSSVPIKPTKAKRELEIFYHLRRDKMTTAPKKRINVYQIISGVRT